MNMNGVPLSILLVEDNDDHAEVVRRSFRSHQVVNEIHHVTNGQAALDYLFRRADFSDPATSPRPHVIVLDLRLPKVDGLEVLREIKEDNDLRRIPVVILTSSQGERDVAMAYDHHANSYLVKPLDFKKFTELMRDLGFYWLAWNVHPFVDGASD
jgi:CheY-like chemotaxis protein